MDIMNLISQAKKMQEDIQKTKDTLKNKIVEAESGAGMVKVIMDGTFAVRKIEISDELFLANDKRMMEDLITAAIKNAHNKVIDVNAEEMSKYASMMPNIPGLNL
jgi:DNA-binding YbaB/EbfC family protein